MRRDIVTVERFYTEHAPPYANFPPDASVTANSRLAPTDLPNFPLIQVFKPHHTLDDLHLQRLERSAHVGTRDTFSSERLVRGTVGLANEMGALCIEKPRVSVIQGDRDMPTYILIRDHPTGKKCHESFPRDSFLLVSELHREPVLMKFLQ